MMENIMSTPITPPHSNRRPVTTGYHLEGELTDFNSVPDGMGTSERARRGYILNVETNDVGRGHPP
jgi:hypothetical protein